MSSSRGPRSVPAKDGPAVTTITTVYNGERFLGEAIRSLTRQTVENIQIVVVVDGSIDDSASIAADAAASDPRIEVLVLPRVGRSGALNFGLSVARAPFVAILDADDLAHPQRLEHQLAWFRDRPESDAVLATLRIGFTGGTILPDVPPPPYRAVPISGDLRRGCPMGHSTAMIRRSALEAVAGYDVRRTSQVDYDLYIRLVTAGYTLHRLQVELAGLRFHAGQLYGGGPQLAYRASSWMTQLRAVRNVDGPLSDLAFLAARGGYLALRSAVPQIFAGRWGVNYKPVELPHESETSAQGAPG